MKRSRALISMFNVFDSRRDAFSPAFSFPILFVFVMNVYVGRIFRAINFELEPQNTPITGCMLPDFDAYSFY